MSAAHRLSSSGLIATPPVAPRQRRATRALAAALEPLERRVCLSVSFSGPVSWSTGNEPGAVAAGDFNNDGKQDLVTANNAGANVSILLGNGSGGFAAPTNIGAGANAVAVTVRDLNADGNQDLAVTVDTPQFNGVFVLLGNGSGGFTSTGLFTAGTNPGRVAVADFNGDDNQDLAVVNSGSDNVSILLGNGSGGFSAPTNFPVGDSPNSVVAEDFNSDGHADLAISNFESDNLTLLIGDGTGNFGSTTFLVGDGPNSVSAADFDEDGILDLAVSNRFRSSLSVMIGKGSGGFSSPTDFPAGSDQRFATPADLDGDGHLDLVTVNDFTGDLSVLIGDGTGQFTAPLTFAAGNAPGRLAVADFNGDGRQDLAASNSSSDSLSVLLNTTNAPLQLANVTVTSSVLENGIATLSGDINHSVSGHSFTLLVNWGDGSTPEEFTYPVGTTIFSETHRYLDDDPTATPFDPIAIQLTLTDDGGLTTTGSANLTVENVAPEVTLGAGGTVRGVPLGFAGSFTDVGTLDTHEVEWNFGDGTVIAFHPTTDPGALTPTHVYSASGSFIVTMTVRDDDTGTTAKTTSVFVSAVGLISDPSAPGKSMLLIGGTAGDDDIRFNRVNRTSNIDAFIGTQYLGRFNPTSRLVVFAGAGNDIVNMDKNISLSAILLGGEGDDVMSGGGGRDILVGGTGADGLNGGGDDDILIGGTTSHDSNLFAFGKILNEWTSSQSLANRVNNLKTGGGLSGGFALNASTVFDDGAIDNLTGNAGKDWFLFGTGDVLTDLSSQDAATFV